MKTNALLLGFSALLIGCQTAPASRDPAPAVVPVAIAPLPAQVRAPEVVKTYTIGAYVDPDDPTLRHEAHTVQRIEAAAYWDLRPGAEMPTVKSTPPAQAEQLPAAAAPAQASPPAVVAAPPSLPPVELTIDPEPALMPNADGVIDLTSMENPATGELNPFAVRALPTLLPREIELRVTGILAGARPCAVINGQLVEPGGTIEGFSLKRIEPAAVVLTLGRHRLRVPMAAEPTRVRTTP